jgi:hypothetical protein
MDFAIGVFTHTPRWVWLLFAYLVWQGIKSLQPRTTSIWRALIVPAVFIVWGLSRLGLNGSANLSPLLSWIGAALVFFAVGMLTPRSFELDPVTNRIKWPGSRFPLIRNLIVFTAQFGVGVITAIDVGDRVWATNVGRAISGATAGYFIGSTVVLLRAFWMKRGTAKSPES